jgi:hypothetical protein
MIKMSSERLEQNLAMSGPTAQVNFYFSLVEIF